MKGRISLLYCNSPDRGWQRNEGLLLLHSFLSLDILVAFSILRFGSSAKSVLWVGLTQFNRTWLIRRCQCVAGMCRKRRHMRLLCLLGTSCEVPPSAATRGTSECAGAFWGRKNWTYQVYPCIANGHLKVKYAPENYCARLSSTSKEAPLFLSAGPKIVYVPLLQVGRLFPSLDLH